MRFWCGCNLESLLSYSDEGEWVEGTSSSAGIVIYIYNSHFLSFLNELIPGCSREGEFASQKAQIKHKKHGSTTYGSEHTAYFRASGRK